MKIYPFQAIYPNFDLIPSPEIFFSSGNYDFSEHQKNGFFRKSGDDSIYIYVINAKHRSHVGLVACVDVRSYIEGTIVQHEKTLATKEQMMMQAFLKRQAMMNPVLLGYETDSRLDQMIAGIVKDCEPFFSINFEEDDQKHHFFRVQDKKLLNRICHLFEKKVERAYIADGHHRFVTGAKLFQTKSSKFDRSHKYQYILCAFFPFNQLEIHDYNRVVHALGDISTAKLFAKMSRVFDIKYLRRPQKPKRKHELTMYLQHEWYRLRWRTKILKKYHRNHTVLLDTHLLNKEVMNKIVGIQDFCVDPRLTYVPGILGLRGLIERINAQANSFGFCLYPIKKQDWISIANKGESMPPKSTWFEPRIRNGMVVKVF